MMQSSDSKQRKYVEFVFTTKEEGKGELLNMRTPKNLAKLERQVILRIVSLKTRIV